MQAASLAGEGFRLEGGAEERQDRVREDPPRTDEGPQGHRDHSRVVPCRTVGAANAGENGGKLAAKVQWVGRCASSKSFVGPAKSLGAAKVGKF